MGFQIDGGIAQLGAQAVGCATPQKRNTLKIEKSLKTI
jgi:hypothetical protein